jgi:cellulose synthase/poly-beta-1,6-N-acetylglucosamine synthase-like glycosyltransferase
MYVIDYLFLGFAFISLYLMALFMMLFIKNRGAMFSEQPHPEVLPSISLIIPAYNEAEHIVETIRAAKSLSYPSELFEIIVLDDGSSDGTAQKAAAEGVRVISQKNAGKSAALNAGVKEAAGEIVGCIDADSYPMSDALLKMVPYFEDKRVAAVTSSIFVKDPKNFLEKLQEMEYILIAWNRKLLDYLHSVYVTPGPLSLYRKGVLEKIGGFKGAVLTEDIEIAWRMQKEGYLIRMALPAKVFTRVPSSFKVWWSQRLRWDIGGIQTVNAYRQEFLSRRHGIFGMFVVPYFSLSIIISLLGLGLFIYLVVLRASNFLDFWYYAQRAGVSVFEFFLIDLMPNVFTVMGVLVFVLSIVYLVVGLRSMKKSLLNVQTFFEMLVYLSVYLFLFPILLVQSFWRLMVYKKQKW